MWLLYVDGSATSQAAGAGIVLISPDGDEVQYALRFGFSATNNEAEYEALLAGLELAKKLAAFRVTVFSDSQLVVSQIQGNYEARGSHMQKYLAKAKTLLLSMKECKIVHVNREENARADALAKLASAPGVDPVGSVFIEELPSRSIEHEEVFQAETTQPSWMEPILRYKREGTLPDDPQEARAVRRSDARHTLVGEQLYRRSFSGPLLKCVPVDLGKRILEEVHEGACGAHEGARALVGKAFRAGFYWPTARSDARELVKRCDKCQRYASVPRCPGVESTPITAPWPFAQWGIDLLGPFPPAAGARKFVIVAVDYFTKWVEAEPLAQITEEQARKFVWRNIFTRFGIPRILISDNGTQFTGRRFTDFCKEFGVQQRFTSVAHPQSNGQTEVVNRIVLQGLKKRLDERKGAWADELPSVLWSYRTTPREPTGETPFSLVFGVEAVTPLELMVVSPRVQLFDEAANEEALGLELDLLEERRHQAQVRNAHYKQITARFYNSRVRQRQLRPGDLVLRRAEVSQPAEARGKLAPTWEGPYKVDEIAGPGSYHLRRLDGTEVPRSWHVQNLRMYYA